MKILNLNALCILFGTLVMSLPARVQAQSADSLIAQGRAFLATQDIDNANARFAAAVAANSGHQTANALYAATRILVLPNQPAVKAFLDRLGLSQTNRSIYHWNPSVPRETNHTIIAPAGVNASEATAVLRANVLPEISAAAANLAKITDTNFLLNLTSNETQMADVTVDYGDVQLLRAFLHAGEYLGYTLNAQNWDAQLTEVRSLLTNKTTTVEDALVQYPHLLMFATTNDMAAASTAFQNAVDRYLDASAWIRGREPSLPRLFNYDPDQTETEANFRSILRDLKHSLNGDVQLSVAHDYGVQFSRHFAGQAPFRSFLPAFHGNEIVLGTLPDPTFDSLLFGLSRIQIEELASHKLAMVPRLSANRLTTDGQFRMQLNGLDRRAYTIELSDDLRQWTRLGNLASTQGIAIFTDPWTGGAIKRFYRAVETQNDYFTNRITLTGLFATGYGSFESAASHTLWWTWTAPVTGLFGLATDSSSAKPAVFTGSDIANIVRVSPASEGTGGLFFNATAGTTYHLAINQTSDFGYYHPDEIYLALAAIPGNDLFVNRERLTGTNVTIEGHDIGATGETGEEQLNYPANSPSVWYTWTAPTDGNLTVRVDGRTSFYLGIHTGSELSSLARVATGDERVDLDVKAGTAYQIRIGGGETVGAFTLKLTFSADAYPLYTQVYPDGGGTIHVEPPPGFSGTYPRGSVLTLKADPAQCMVFSGWASPEQGAITNTNSSIDITVTASQEKIAVFRPKNDDFARRTVLAGTNTSTVGTIAGANKEAGEPNETSQYNGSVWWSWTSPRDGAATVTLNTERRWAQFGLAIFSGSTLADLKAIASGNTGEYYEYSLYFAVKAGTTYHLAVAGANTDEYSDSTTFRMKLAAYASDGQTSTDFSPASFSGITIAFASVEGEKFNIAFGPQDMVFGNGQPSERYTYQKTGLTTGRLTSYDPKDNLTVWSVMELTFNTKTSGTVKDLENNQIQGSFTVVP